MLISRHFNLLKWGLRSESPPPERFADESGDVGGQAAVEEFFQTQVFPSDRWQKTGLAGLAFWASCFGRDQRPRKSVSPTCHRHVFRLPFCGFRTLSRRLLMAKRPENASRGVSFLKYAHRQDEPRKAASQWKHPLISRCGWRPKLVNEPKRAQNCPESGLAIRNDGAN